MDRNFLAEARWLMMQEFAELTERHARVTSALDDFTRVRSPTVEEMLTYLLRDSPILPTLKEILAIGMPPGTPPREHPFPAASVSGVTALLDLALTLQMLMACSDIAERGLCAARVVASVTFESGHSCVMGMGADGDVMVKAVKLAEIVLATPETPAPPEAPVSPPAEADDNADLV